MRGLGIRRVAYEPVAVVGLVVDLGAADAERLPEPAAQTAEIERHHACRGLRSQPAPTRLPLVLAYCNAGS